MSPKLSSRLLAVLAVAAIGCGSSDFQSIAANSGQGGAAASSGNGGKSGNAGNAGSRAASGGAPGTSGSSAGMSGHGGSAMAGTTGGDMGGDAGMAGDTGIGGTDMATGGSSVDTGGSTAGVGGSSMAGMSGGSPMAGAGTGGSNTAGTGGMIAGAGGIGTGGSAGAGATGGTGGSTGGSAGVGGSSGTGGSTGGTGGSTGGTGGTSAGTGGTSAGSGGTGPVCTIGSVCRAAASQCDQPEYYDSDCNCPADLMKADGSSCGSSASNACDDADTCKAGVCQSNHKSAGTFCGGKDVNNCRADECDGNGSCVPNQPAFAGQQCGVVGCTAGVVTGVGACDGINTGCVQSTFDCNGSCNSSGTACAYNSGDIDTSSDAQNVLATDNDVDAFYVAARSTAGTTKIVKYSKVDYTAKTTLFTDSNTSTNWVGAMIVAGTSLYFSENNGSGAGGIYKINTTSSNQTATQVTTYPTFGFAKNSTKVFWTNAQNAVSTGGTFHVYNVTIGATASNMMNPTINNIGTDIEADDSGVYVWFLGTATNGTYSPVLYRYSITNATTLTYSTSIAPTLPDGNDEPRCTCTIATMPGLTKNANGVIFANVNYNLHTFGGVGGASTIFKYSGSVTTLTTSSPIDSAMNFAADTNNVYTQNMKIPVNGGTQDYYTSNKLVFNTLTADGTQVFFGSSGYWTSQPPYSGTPDVQRSALVQTTP